MKDADGIGQHPINKDAVSRWIQRVERLEDVEERNFYSFFANAFASILETSYVTYPVFLSRVHIMAEEILQKIINEDYTYILFVISSEVSKSNLWVSLLCMDYWDKNPLFFNYAHRITIVSTPVNNRFQAGGTSDIGSKKTLLLHFDDMSYSGGQVAQAIRNLWSAPSTLERPKLTSKNIEYYLAIPYITDIAKSYILTHNRGVKVLDSTYMIPNFLDQVQTYAKTIATVNTKNQIDSYLMLIDKMCEPDWFMYSGEDGYRRNPPDSNIQKGVWAFRCAKFKTLIYFDHKLADDASTFQKVLFFGSYPINTKKNDGSFRIKERLPVCEYESLIQGCSINKKVLNNFKRMGVNACRNYVQYGSKKWNIDQDVICPKTFYKQISYQFSIRFKKDKTRTIVGEPYIFTAESTLLSNIGFFLNNVLFDNFDLLYPSQTEVEDSQKIKIFEDKYITALSTKVEVLAARRAPAHPWQNYNNIGLEKALKSSNNSKGLFSRMFGSILPFSGGKTRRKEPNRKKHTLTRKH